MGYSVSNKSSSRSFYEDYKSRQHGNNIFNLNSDSFKVNTDTNNANDVQYFDNSATQNSVEVEVLDSLSTNDMENNIDILKKTLDETKAQLEEEIEDLEKELSRNEDLYSGGDPRFKRQAPANPELTEKINEKTAELNQINSYSYQIEQQTKIQPYEEKRQTEDFQNFLNNYSSDYQGIDWGLMESTGYDVNLYCMELARGMSSEEREKLISEGKNQIDTVAMVEYLLSKTDTTAENFNPKLYLGPGLQDAYDLYQYMSQEQREMYHYVFKTEGEEAANRYKEIIQDSINQAKGAKEAEDFINNLDLNNQEELERSLMNFLEVSKGGLGDGILNFFAGIENVFKDNKVLSSDEYKTMIVLQYLAEHSKFYDEIYEGSSSIGNMLPAIAASVVVSFFATPAAGDVVGNVLMGISEGGNSKHQARVNGHDVVSSTIYGILNGSSETLIDHFLGNIPWLNKESTSALKGLFKEGVGESIQELSTAAFGATVLQEDVDWSTLPEQTLKAFVMGAIVSGIMNGSFVTIPLNGVNTTININDVISYTSEHPDVTVVDAFKLILKNKGVDLQTIRKYDETDLKDSIEEMEKQENSLSGFIDENGKLLPEREAVHRQIIDEFLKGKTPIEGQAEMRMMGGGPASGKSSVGSFIKKLDERSTITIDPDKIKEKLPGYEEMSKVSSTAASYYHEESSALAKRLAAVSLKENYNVIYDGTGDGSVNSVMKKVDSARAQGYKVSAVYVTIDTDEAVIRNRQRYEDAIAKGESPRLVPDAYVRDCHRKVTNISMECSDKFDSIELYDNNGPKGSTTLIATGGNGEKLSAVPGKEVLFENFLKKGNVSN